MVTYAKETVSTLLRLGNSGSIYASLIFLATGHQSKDW